jgi:hypothetical protein
MSDTLPPFSGDFETHSPIDAAEKRYRALGYDSGPFERAMSQGQAQFDEAWGNSPEDHETPDDWSEVAKRRGLGWASTMLDNYANIHDIGEATVYEPSTNGSHKQVSLGQKLIDNVRSQLGKPYVADHVDVNPLYGYPSSPPYTTHPRRQDRPKTGLVSNHPRQVSIQLYRQLHQRLRRRTPPHPHAPLRQTVVRYPRSPRQCRPVFAVYRLPLSPNPELTRELSGSREGSSLALMDRIHQARYSRGRRDPSALRLDRCGRE